MGSLHSPDGDKWAKQATQEEVLEAFSGFGEDPQKIIRCMERPSKWSIHVVHPNLNSFVKGNVALLGDSVRSETRTAVSLTETPPPDFLSQAHAMLPYLGAGAGQGIEDAYVLASLLGHPQTKARNLEVQYLLFPKSQT
jgi:salicylate hydroxylase